MRDIATKSTGDSLTAVEFNDIPTELENAITSAGIGLSSGDLTQLAKAISVYASGSDFYTDSGAADAYVLAAIGLKSAPPLYFTGMQIAFISGNANTGPSTVNVNSLGVKSIVLLDGSALPAGVIAASRIIIARYDGTNFVLISNATLAALAGVVTAADKLIYANGVNQFTTTTLTAFARTLLDDPDAATARQTLGVPTLETPQATTSGTSVDFTGIPAGTKQITVMFSGVSLDAAAFFVGVQLGDSGGIEATGYASSAAVFSNGSTAALFQDASHFRIWKAQFSADAWSGSVILSLVDSSTNTWAMQGTTSDGSTYISMSAGVKSLSGTLDRLRVLAVGANFDAGSVNISYM